MSYPTEIVEPWIYTYSGQKVDLFDPDPETLRLIDIAHALSNIGRWGGHTSFFYSVAQHSVIVSQNCAPHDAMAGLFHDAAEAYLGDVCRPLKRSPFLRDYCLVYHNMEQVIFKKFVGSIGIPESVRLADERLLATEALALMGKRSKGTLENDEWLYEGDPLNIPLAPQLPNEARQGFLQRFYRLSAINPGYTV